MTALNRQIERDGFFAAMDALRNVAKGLKDRALPGPHNYAQIPELAERGRARLGHFFRAMDARFAERQFVAGSRYTIADISTMVLIDLAGWTKITVPDECAHLRRWYAAVSAKAERESVRILEAAMPDEFKSLLLEEYKARSEAMAKSEQAGETRVNLFIGLITLVGGGAGTLLTKESSIASLSHERRVLIVVALCSLLVVGVITLFRLITRNKHTDLCKRQLDQLRQAYKDQFDTDGSWAHYDLFPPVAKEEGDIKKKGRAAKKKDEADEKKGAAKKDEAAGDRLLPRQFGGLAFVVSGLNTLLLTAAVAVLAYPRAGESMAGYVVGLLAVLVGAFALQAWYVSHKEKAARAESKKQYPQDNRAGGIVFRMSGGVPKYLLVKPKELAGEKPKEPPSEPPVEWVLPKGHIDPGESHVQAAVREVAEEAGVAARPMGLAGRIRFKSKGEDVVAKFYLMEWIGKVPPKEARSPDWFALAEAQEKLAVESKGLLRLAEQRRLLLVAQAAPASPKP